MSKEPAAPPFTPPDAPPALELRGIDKRFGAVHANRAITFAVAAGSIHGLIGENGAGKSTLMNIVYGFHRADAGEIRVRGRVVAIGSQQEAIAAGIGMVHQHFMLVENFTVLENVVLGVEGGARLARGLAAARTELGRLARDYGLEVPLDAVVSELSVGLQQRVEILKALYRGAEVLILDEPSVGLDIESRFILWEFLRQLRDAGTTVLITSHYLEEIDALADRLAIIDQGLVIAEGSPSDLKDRVGGDRVTLRIREFADLAETEQAKQLLKTLPFVEDIIINTAQGNSLNLVVTAQSNPLSQIEQTLMAADLPIFSLAQSRPSLDDVYLAATGRTLMDAEIAAASRRDLKAEQKQAMKSPS